MNKKDRLYEEIYQRYDGKYGDLVDAYVELLMENTDLKMQNVAMSFR